MYIYTCIKIFFKQTLCQRGEAYRFATGSWQEEHVVEPWLETAVGKIARLRHLDQLNWASLDANTVRVAAVLVGCLAVTIDAVLQNAM